MMKALNIYLYSWFFSLPTAEQEIKVIALEPSSCDVRVISFMATNIYDIDPFSKQLGKSKEL